MKITHIGQEIFLKSTDKRKKDLVKKCFVSKIGRKYFEVLWQGAAAHRSIKFTLADLEHVTNYCSEWIVCFSVKEVANENKKEELIYKMRDFFSLVNKVKKLSLQQLEEIDKILEGEKS